MANGITIALGISLIFVGALNLEAGLSGHAVSRRGGVLVGVMAMCIGAINIVFGIRGYGLPGAWLFVMAVVLACLLWVVASDVRKSKRTTRPRG